MSCQRLFPDPRLSTRVSLAPNSLKPKTLTAYFLALLPGIDESAITRIVEKTKAKGFNPHDFEEDIGNVVSAVKAAKK